MPIKVKKKKNFGVIKSFGALKAKKTKKTE